MVELSTRLTGVQVYTIALAGFGILLVIEARRAYDRSQSMGSNLGGGRMRGGELKHMVGVVALAAGVFLAVAAGIPEWKRWQYRDVRQALLDELQPVALSNCTLARVGSANDGGYLMCANLISGIQVAYSYGVGPNDQWGCAVSRQHRVQVHQYDCFDPARPTCDGGQFVFHNECIADQSQTMDGRVFDTLVRQLAQNGDTGRRKVVKIDIEGAEWSALLQTPDEVLDSIDQIPMELHGVHEQRMVDVVRKLKRTFHVVNLHFNNHGCAREADPLPAMAYQVLLVNKRLGVLDPAAPKPAPYNPLNAPDLLGVPDCQLERSSQ